MQPVFGQQTSKLQWMCLKQQSKTTVTDRWPMLSPRFPHISFLGQPNMSQSRRALEGTLLPAVILNFGTVCARTVQM